MLYEFRIQTGKTGFYPITDKVKEAVAKSGVKDGICVVFCPHTTAAITINENCDPDVVHDLIVASDATFPNRRDFRHMEGNSAAHMKSSVFGASEVLIIENGKLVLGTWQGVYFAEFDGPRTRHYYVKIIAG